MVDPIAIPVAGEVLKLLIMNIFEYAKNQNLSVEEIEKAFEEASAERKSKKADDLPDA